MPSDEVEQMELRHELDLANARLEVAEEFAWPVAILAAFVLYLKWHWNGWVLAAMVPFAYWAIRYKFAKDSKRAFDNATTFDHDE